MSKGIIDPTKVVRAALRGRVVERALLHYYRGDGRQLPKKESRRLRCPVVAAWVEWAEWTIDRAIHLKK